MKKTVINVLGWAGLAVLGFIAIVLACWWLAPDQKLDPEAEKFVTLAPVPPAEDNAYFILWGFPASPELDPHQVGQQIVAEHDRILAAEKGLDHFNMDSFYGPNPLRFEKASKYICQVSNWDCLAEFESKRAEILAATEKYRLYVARYRKIREYKEFGVALSQADFRSPVPNFQAVLRISELVDANIALKMTSAAQQREALQELAADIHSWRRIIQGNDWLLTQMISVVALHKKYRLASALMSKYPEAVGKYPDLFRLITAPLPVEQTNIIAATKAEARSSLNVFRTLSESAQCCVYDDGMSSQWLYAAMIHTGGLKPNASVNRAYGAFKSYTDFLSHSPKQIVEGLPQWDEGIANRVAFDAGAVFYNPVGRRILVNMFPGFTTYAFRIDDLIGLSRLVDLQRQIVEKSVPVADVPAFLAKAGPGLMDIYTEQPMHWDASTKRVWFALQGKRFDNSGYVTLGHYK